MVGRLITMCLYALVVYLTTGVACAQNTLPQPYAFATFGSVNPLGYGCNCYELTNNSPSQAGSLWRDEVVDLAQSFDYRFDFYLGCAGTDGADGIAFVLHSTPASPGSSGGGLGFEGIPNSLAITIDTRQNPEHDDPPEDHIAIQLNGDVQHSSAGNLAGPVPVLESGGDVQDCNTHMLRISWDAATARLSVWVDGAERLTVDSDIIAGVFGGNPLVYWGFTGSTGADPGYQQVCTTLKAAYTAAPGPTACVNDLITLTDQSESFGPIEKWTWEFLNEGMVYDGPSPPPHLFTTPGVQDVMLTIEGNGGCVSDPVFADIILDSEPVAGFQFSAPEVCPGTPVSFTDNSYVDIGEIVSWSWTIGGQPYEFQNPTNIEIYGSTPVELVVETANGCRSQPHSATVTTFPSPSVDFSFEAVCTSLPARFNAVNMNASVPVTQWQWDFGDGHTLNSPNSQGQHQYQGAGAFDVQLTAVSDQGCRSAPVSRVVDIIEINAFAGNDTVVARNQPLALQGSGGDAYLWRPSAVLDADNIPNPVARLTADTEFVLTVTGPQGCTDTDTVRVKVYQVPEFLVPSAFTPNNDGRNDRFRFTAVGIQSFDRLQIYNRYGQLVFSTSDVSAGWDGRVNGIDQPTGTYVWMIRGTDYTGTPHFKKGTVTLIR